MSIDVVITSSAVTTPLGNDVQENYDRLLDRNPAFSKYELHPKIASNQQICWRGRVGALETKLLYERKVQKLMVRRDIMGLICLIKAAHKVNVTKQCLNAERSSIFVGSASTQIGDLQPYKVLLEEACSEGELYDPKIFGRKLTAEVSPMVMMQNLMNNVVCYGSIAFDLRGPNCNLMDFHASGLLALGEAFYALREGRSDFALAGGIACEPDRFYQNEGARRGYLLVGCEQKSADKLVQPFHRKGPGTVMSEGTGFVCMESLEHAQKGGRAPLAEVEFYANGTLSAFGGESEQSIQTLEQLLHRYFAETGALPESLLIWGNAGGIAADDQIEIQALRRVATQRNFEKLRVTSAKSMLGDVSEATGPVNIALALESFKRKIAPGVSTSNEDLMTADRVEVLTENLSWDFQRALVMVFGFSGSVALMGIKRVC
jgi:3-oxoacyl-[acyl-carrier-protein] synthase II